MIHDASNCFDIPPEYTQWGAELQPGRLLDYPSFSTEPAEPAFLAARRPAMMVCLGPLRGSGLLALIPG